VPSEEPAGKPLARRSSRIRGSPGSGTSGRETMRRSERRSQRWGGDSEWSAHSEGQGTRREDAGAQSRWSTAQEVDEEQAAVPAKRVERDGRRSPPRPAGGGSRWQKERGPRSQSPRRTHHPDGVAPEGAYSQQDQAPGRGQEVAPQQQLVPGREQGRQRLKARGGGKAASFRRRSQLGQL